jgi:hypothetical protein
MSSTVLAHLVNRFAVHPENLATEALSFSLKGSRAARDALARLVTLRGYPLTEDVSYETQVSSVEGGRPDLVGRDSTGRARLVIEAKFWAGLTDHQPVSYLTGSIVGEGPACVLFVAPHRRRETLWPKLISLCTDQNLPVTDVPESGGVQCCRVGTNVLALADWSSMLQAMISACSDAGEKGSVADLLQLLALCEEQDTTAFLPLHREELTGSLGRRITQFEQLVAALTDRLCGKNPIGDVRGLRGSNAVGAHYSRYIRLRGYPAMLRFLPALWAQHGSAPLWVAFSPFTWGSPQPSVPTKAREHLRGVAFLEEENYLHVPLNVPEGCEFDEVLSSLESQVRALMARFPPADFAAVDAAPAENTTRDG